MKKSILIIALLLFTLSCNKSIQDEFNDLKTQNERLKSQVEVLKDSLSKFEEDFLYSQLLLGIADEPVLKVGEENNIVMLFHTHHKKLPEYEIYKIDGNEKIKVGNDSITRFNYTFTPKSLNDNVLKLFVKMRYKENIIEFPAEMYFDLKE